MNKVEKILEAYISEKKERLSVIFFRVGSAYITLFDDARLISKVLNVKTKMRRFDDHGVEYISFKEEELFLMIQSLNQRSIIPCVIVETEELDF